MILVNVLAPFTRATFETQWIHKPIRYSHLALPFSSSIVFIAISDVGVCDFAKHFYLRPICIIQRGEEGPGKGTRWRTMSWTCNEFSIVLYELDDSTTVCVAMPPRIVTWLTLSWPARYVVNCYHLRSKPFIYKRVKNTYCAAHREVSNAPQ